MNKGFMNINMMNIYNYYNFKNPFENIKMNYFQLDLLELILNLHHIS